MNRIRIAFALLVAVTATAGCDLINGPSELEREIAAEQQIIKTYSAAVPEVDALKTTFLDAWKKANELKDLKAYKEALQTQVVAALGAYVAATAKMPAAARATYLEQLKTHYARYRVDLVQDK